MLLHTTGGTMKTLNYADALARFDEVLDSVLDEREEVVITRTDGAAVVMVALDDYEALKETVYLLRSPANAHRLLDAMGRLDAADDRQEKNILLALHEAAAEIGGVEVVTPPLPDPAHPVDLS
jgi:antitoxin YefM